MTDSRNKAEECQVFNYICQKYGLILTIEDITEIFKYPTESAVRKSYSRGTLPVTLTVIPGKKGLYATAAQVAAAIVELQIQKEE